MRGKRPISERPAGAENRSWLDHLEGDTVIGAFDRHCILTLVDRKTGHVMIGKRFGRTTAATNRRTAALIRNAPRRTLSLTMDHGTECHGFKALEKERERQSTSPRLTTPGRAAPARTRTD
jgi:transposase, IS30 family